MPLHWQPVGPLPPAVYWRRRVLLLLAVLLVVAALAWLLGRGGGEDRLEPAAAPTASPTATSPSPSPSTPSPTPTAEPCPDTALEVQATAAAADVPPGAGSVLTLAVRNTGTVPCRRALGQGALELVVTSGDDRIWSSDDCAPGGDPGEVVLPPGEVRSARATWPGTRSAPGCPADQPAAAPGTYRVTGRVGELRVPGMVFRVTG